MPIEDLNNILCAYTLCVQSDLELFVQSDMNCPGALCSLYLVYVSVVVFIVAYFGLMICLCWNVELFL